MSPAGPDDEFFIGWEGKTLPRTRAHMRKIVALCLLAAAGVAGALAAVHSPAAPSRFEFGVERTFEGRLEHVPYPTLVVDRPGGGSSRWLLTVFGKFGAEPATLPFDGHRVRMSGSLIHRGAHTMVELLPDSIEDLGEESAQDLPPFEGEVTLRGEIVDSKCYLGVMKPGNLKPHRACAARCISGGVPPVLVVRGEDGAAPRYLLLAGPNGAAIGKELLPFVGESVEVTGAVRELGALDVLTIEPKEIVR